MKKFLSVLPFVLVFVLLVGSVFVTRAIHSKSDNVYPVNTALDKDGKIYTIRVFKSISLVMAVDLENHAKKKEIKPDFYSYNPETTELVISDDFLLYDKTVIHIEGEAALPETFCVHDFEGTADSLLVLLRDREAIENLEYTFDRESRTITFRSDIHPEKDGQYFIMYETADGATHSFGNWIKDTDRLATLQWQWLARVKNAPPLVMKDRSRVSNRKISKEVGFKINLPKGDSTFISEKMENGEKNLSVARWYDKIGLLVECKNTPFSPSDDENSPENTEIIQIGEKNFKKQKITGTHEDENGEKSPVPLVVYGWEKDGTNYQISVEEEKASVAEAFLGKM